MNKSFILKVLALTLLCNGVAQAMEAEPIAKSQTVEENFPKKSHSLSISFKDAGEALKNAPRNLWSAIKFEANLMKEMANGIRFRGLNDLKNWETHEKVTAGITSAIIVAVLGYGSYKVYKALSKKNKNKNVERESITIEIA